MKKIMLSITLALLTQSALAETTPSPAPEANQANPIIDPSMNLNKTMKTMGRHLRAIERSGDWNERLTAVKELKAYTNQGRAQGLANPESKDDDVAYEKAMSDLLAQVEALEAAIVAQDEAKMAALIEDLKKARRQGHQYFKID